MNTFRTAILLAALTALLLVIGQVIGGRSGMLIGLAFALLINMGAYWFSDKLVLSMYHAQEVTPAEAPELYQIVRELIQRAGLPMPKVYIVQSETPNAFATGRNPEHAAIAATTGILKILSREELTGVIAHELSHVYHRDTLISAISATIAGAIGMLANIAQWAMIFGFGREDNNREGPGLIATLLMAILAPIAATLIQLAISRSREFSADEAGAKLCGHPLWLASALQKLETVNKQIPLQTAVSNPATAHLFIVNPLAGTNLMQLFSTHPPLEERIARLQAMAAGER